MMDFEQAQDAMIKQDFLAVLKGLAWCKQGDSTLVAVHKCTPEIIAIMKDRPVKVLPGGMVVKSNKSFLSSLKEQFDDGLAVPLLLVWKAQWLEMIYRRHKSMDFPYDSWSDPVAAAYEREQLFITSADIGKDFAKLYGELLTNANACPAIIPPQ
jgi:hypothetical protein